MVDDERRLMQERPEHATSSGRPTHLRLTRHGVLGQVECRMRERDDEELEIKQLPMRREICGLRARERVLTVTRG